MTTDKPRDAAAKEPTKLGKTQRQYLVAKLIEAQAVPNQAALVDLLAAEGVAATQATVSRDLEELGAIKVRMPGRRDRLRHPRAARRSSWPPRTTSAASSATGWSRWHTPTTSSWSARRPARPTSWPRPSTAPACPACSAPSPATTRSSWSSTADVGGEVMARRLSDLAGL